MPMTNTKRNQERLQMQQLEQAHGGDVLKNIFSISSRHPLLSLLFVIVFALFTNSLYELLNSLFATSPYQPQTLYWQTGILFALLVVIFVTVLLLHRGSVRPSAITRKKLLVTLASAHKQDIMDLASYGVYEALLYSPRGHSLQNSLEEVIIIATEDNTTQKIAKKFVKYVEKSGRLASVKTVSVNDRTPKDIKRQLALVLSEASKPYTTADIVCDYTGGTKNLSIALYQLAAERFISQVYFTDAMMDSSKRAAITPIQ